MNKYFVIMAQTDSKFNDTKITSELKNLGVAWWHWIDGAWLVKSSKDTLKAKDIRNAISKLGVSYRCLVIEVDPIHWAGKGPTSSDNSMFEWLRKNWPVDD